MGWLAGREITVLGAGVAGLAFGWAAAQRDAKVILLEQAEAVREVGAGLQIGPNGARVLRALGLDSAALDRVAMQARSVEMHDGLSGKRLLRMDLGARARDPGHYLFHRADLIEVLAQGARAAGVQLHLLTKVAGVDLSGDTPLISTAQGAQMRPALLIGADGLQSPTRAALNGLAKPFFTGQAAWRAVIAGDPNDAPVVQAYLGPGRHLVSYPLRGGKLRNIIAVVEQSEWVEESWSLSDDPAKLRRAFSGFNPQARRWLDAVQDCGFWGLFRHPVAATWQREMPDGAVAIVGDAVHPTLPFLAQGAAMGLEDAHTLARTLDRDGTAGLAQWQAERAPRCQKIVDGATSNARAFHLRGPMRLAGNLALRMADRVASGAMLARYDWIYDYDATR
ncbi:FAD-dependent monooxygenase [Neogemmobacter tilapiae]|uniref:Monooxygenase n=1 Tax=Neogemmobacter tilapiae TaxID=875041 RepID=A0A918WGJ6_9RHOB|nr:FAD-dependent monooxygenase [Gemmobacter tilapiae]GHC44610.1 monooxygenase [Gemmobacter tilapiae]